MKTEPGLAAVLLDTMVSVEVPVDTKLLSNTKLGTPALDTDANKKGSVITIKDSTPNDILHTIPSTPKKNCKKNLEVEIIPLDTSYCAQALCVTNTTSHVLFKYPFEGWTDLDNLDLDITSDVTVEHG